MIGDTSNWARLREVAGEIAAAKAMATVLRYRGDKQAEEAEANMQDAWREFDTLIAKLRTT